MRQSELSPRDMFDVVKSLKPEWSNSKIRRVVEAYNTGHAKGARVSAPSLRYLIEWMDPTAQSAIRRHEN